MHAYEDDLAYIHDVEFGGFARGSAPWILDILHQSGVTGGLVVDLGCGSGIWARELADAGYKVLGIDISSAMIKIAQQRVPDGEFRVESFLKHKPPPCQAVTSLGEVFNYRFDKRNSLEALGQLFRRVYFALKPGGLFIFDVAEPGRNRSSPRQRHWEGSDWAILVEIEPDAQGRRLTRRIVTFRKVGQLYRRHEETHRLQLYKGTDVVSMLRKIGFRVRQLRGYGKYRFPKSYAGIVARKP